MTKIEWVKNQDGTQGRSWNPITGCSHAGSLGCDNCYARRMARRLAGRCGYPAAPHHFDVTLRPDRLEEPLRRKKSTTYFVCSMSDLFHPDVPTHYIAKVWNVMRQCPQHTFQVLTKRPEAMLSILLDWDVILPNVWLGVSVENSDYLWRVEVLMKCPAAVRFVSAEPLLGEIDFSPWIGQVWIDCLDGAREKRHPHNLDQIIVGGESGPGARPMHPEWVRSIRDQCVAVGVPFFMKQWGAWAHVPSDTKHSLPQKIHWWPDRNLMGHVGKKRAGRLLDGREWNEMPNV